MGTEAITARYVHALLERVPVHELGRVQEEIHAASELWRANADLRCFMLNPFIAAKEKQAAMSRLAERADWLEAVRNFLGVLVENKRIGLLEELAPVVARSVRGRFGRKIATIETPVPLSDDETSALAQRLGQRLGLTLIPQVEVKPELLGGVRVRVGDTVYDASIVGALRALSRELAKG